MRKSQTHTHSHKITVTTRNTRTNTHSVTYTLTIQEKASKNKTIKTKLNNIRMCRRIKLLLFIRSRQQQENALESLKYTNT